MLNVVLHYVGTPAWPRAMTSNNRSVEWLKSGYNSIARAESSITGSLPDLQVALSGAATWLPPPSPLVGPPCRSRIRGGRVVWSRQENILRGCQTGERGDMAKADVASVRSDAVAVDGDVRNPRGAKT